MFFRRRGDTTEKQTPNHIVNVRKVQRLLKDHPRLGCYAKGHVWQKKKSQEGVWIGVH